jgi:hypothetical protein
VGRAVAPFRQARALQALPPAIDCAAEGFAVSATVASAGGPPPRRPTRPTAATPPSPSGFASSPTTAAPPKRGRSGGCPIMRIRSPRSPAPTANRFTAAPSPTSSTATSARRAVSCARRTSPHSRPSGFSR